MDMAGRFLEFVEQSNRADSASQITALFKTSIAGMGFDKFIYSRARAASHSESNVAHGIADAYPDDWMRHYIAKNYLKHDPCFRFALTTQGAMPWADFRGLSRLERQILNEGDEAGLKNGVLVAVHGPGGALHGFGLAGDSPREPFTRSELSLTAALANQFHLAHASLDLSSRQEASVRLTEKQKDVLCWSAQGKSRSVIAEIMGISDDAVADHFRRIFRKLDCHDRTVAVLKAVKLGLIQI